MSAILWKLRFPGRKYRSIARGGRRQRIWTIERLEDRSLFANFAVNALSDTVDANPGDGLANDESGMTTLCAAIMEANATRGTT